MKQSAAVYVMIDGLAVSLLIVSIGCCIYFLLHIQPPALPKLHAFAAFIPVIVRIIFMRNIQGQDLRHEFKVLMLKEQSSGIQIDRRTARSAHIILLKRTARLGIGILTDKRQRRRLNLKGRIRHLISVNNDAVIAVAILPFSDR